MVRQRASVGIMAAERASRDDEPRKMTRKKDVESVGNHRGWSPEAGKRKERVNKAESRYPEQHYTRDGNTYTRVSISISPARSGPSPARSDRLQNVKKGRPSAPQRQRHYSPVHTIDPERISYKNIVAHEKKESKRISTPFFEEETDPIPGDIEIPRTIPRTRSRSKSPSRRLESAEVRDWNGQLQVVVANSKGMPENCSRNATPKTRKVTTEDHNRVTKKDWEGQVPVIVVNSNRKQKSAFKPNPQKKQRSSSKFYQRSKRHVKPKSFSVATPNLQEGKSSSSPIRVDPKSQALYPQKPTAPVQLKKQSIFHSARANPKTRALRQRDEIYQFLNKARIHRTKKRESTGAGTKRDTQNLSTRSSGISIRIVDAKLPKDNGNQSTQASEHAKDNCSLSRNDGSQSIKHSPPSDSKCTNDIPDQSAEKSGIHIHIVSAKDDDRESLQEGDRPVKQLSGYPLRDDYVVQAVVEGLSASLSQESSTSIESSPKSKDYLTRLLEPFETLKDSVRSARTILSTTVDDLFGDNQSQNEGSNHTRDRKKDDTASFTNLVALPSSEVLPSSCDTFETITDSLEADRTFETLPCTRPPTSSLVASQTAAPSSPPSESTGPTAEGTSVGSISQHMERPKEILRVISALSFESFEIAPDSVVEDLVKAGKLKAPTGTNEKIGTEINHNLKPSPSPNSGHQRRLKWISQVFRKHRKSRVCSGANDNQRHQPGVTGSIETNTCDQNDKDERSKSILSVMNKHEVGSSSLNENNVRSEAGRRSESTPAVSIKAENQNDWGKDKTSLPHPNGTDERVDIRRKDIVQSETDKRSDSRSVKVEKQKAEESNGEEHLEILQVVSSGSFNSFEIEPDCAEFFISGKKQTDVGATIRKLKVTSGNYRDQLEFSTSASINEDDSKPPEPSPSSDKLLENKDSIHSITWQTETECSSVDLSPSLVSDIPKNKLGRWPGSHAIMVDAAASISEIYTQAIHTVGQAATAANSKFNEILPEAKEKFVDAVGTISDSARLTATAVHTQVSGVYLAGPESAFYNFCKRVQEVSEAMAENNPLVCSSEGMAENNLLACASEGVFQVRAADDDILEGRSVPCEPHIDKQEVVSKEMKQDDDFLDDALQEMAKEYDLLGDVLQQKTDINPFHKRKLLNGASYARQIGNVLVDIAFEKFASIILSILPIDTKKRQMSTAYRALKKLVTTTEDLDVFVITQTVNGLTQETIKIKIPGVEEAWDVPVSSAERSQIHLQYYYDVLSTVYQQAWEAIEESWMA